MTSARRSPRKPRHSRSGEQRGRRSVTPARVAAFDVLMSVAQSDSYANLMLPPMLRSRNIVGRDAAFATELTYGTLRMQARYDAVIEQASQRKLRDLDLPVLVILRLGVHQLLELKIPSHAAVSQSVALTRLRITSGPAQLVNAVLRRISEKPLEEWIPAPADDASDEELASYHSHPAWIVRAFRQALGAQPTGLTDPTPALRQLLEANNTPARVHLALRPGLSGDHDLARVETQPGKYAPTCSYLLQGDPSSVSAVGLGRIGVQDEGSQLVTLASLDAPVEGDDSTWLDLTAGPGGKAAIMASVLGQRGGGEFVANELHEHRSELVKQNLQAIGPEVRVHVRTGDGRDVAKHEMGRYDRVLLDAPCTGLGALRRRPESRWRRSLDDLPALTQLQRELLISALKAVRVGGVVSYITCSPHVAETTLVVTDAQRHLQREGITIELLDASAHLASVSLNPPEGLTAPFAQMWPHVHGTDAMFLALLRRCA